MVVREFWKEGGKILRNCWKRKWMSLVMFQAFDMSCKWCRCVTMINRSSMVFITPSCFKSVLKMMVNKWESGQQLSSPFGRWLRLHLPSVESSTKSWATCLPVRCNTKRETRNYWITTGQDSFLSRSNIAAHSRIVSVASRACFSKIDEICAPTYLRLPSRRLTFCDRDTRSWHLLSCDANRSQRRSCSRSVAYSIHSRACWGKHRSLGRPFSTFRALGASEPYRRRSLVTVVLDDAYHTSRLPPNMMLSSKHFLFTVVLLVLTRSVENNRLHVETRRSTMTKIEEGNRESQRYNSSYEF
jgi:hypothetical protein